MNLLKSLRENQKVRDSMLDMYGEQYDFLKARLEEMCKEDPRWMLKEHWPPEGRFLEFLYKSSAYHVWLVFSASYTTTNVVLMYGWRSASGNQRLFSRESKLAVGNAKTIISSFMKRNNVRV